MLLDRAAVLRNLLLIGTCDIVGLSGRVAQITLNGDFFGRWSWCTTETRPEVICLLYFVLASVVHTFLIGVANVSTNGRWHRPVGHRAAAGEDQRCTLLRETMTGSDTLWGPPNL